MLSSVNFVWYLFEIQFFIYKTSSYIAIASLIINDKVDINIYLSVIYKSTCPEIMFLPWNHLWILQAHLPWQPPFSQHVSWWCCNHLGIPSSTAEILLSNLVFHDRVIPVSVLTLKPLLGVIGVLPLKPRASPILSVCI